MANGIKTINGLAQLSNKTFLGIALASVKTIDGITNLTEPTKLNPTMTNDTTPSGYSTTYSGYWGGGTYPWLAFNGVNDYYDGGGYEAWGITGTSGYVGLMFPSSVLCTRYVVGGTNNPQNSPYAWAFEGYNGSSWVQLDTQTSQTWSGIEKKTFNISNTTAYSGYRLNISSSNSPGSYTVNLAVCELEIWGY